MAIRCLVESSITDHHTDEPNTVTGRASLDYLEWIKDRMVVLLQSYAPFAIIHFQAIQCKSGFDREQCCHFKFHKNRIAGEIYLLTSDDVSSILNPFMGDSDGRVVSGRMRMPKLLNRVMSDTMDGHVYAGKRPLPNKYHIA